mmetsp:Transcript_12298/g.28487  ORF Transcript_12298/g.28487 Transcript_12298/m.28487 type:complete len:212 (+) Transcript_12298:565-1200(+)
MTVFDLSEIRSLAKTQCHPNHFGVPVRHVWPPSPKVPNHERRDSTTKEDPSWNVSVRGTLEFFVAALYPAPPHIVPPATVVFGARWLRHASLPRWNGLKQHKLDQRGGLVSFETAQETNSNHRLFRISPCSHVCDVSRVHFHTPRVSDNAAATQTLRMPSAPMDLACCSRSPISRLLFSQNPRIQKVSVPSSHWANVPGVPSKRNHPHQIR